MPSTEQLTEEQCQRVRELVTRWIDTHTKGAKGDAREKQRKATQKILGDLIGVSQQTISNIMGGRGGVSVATAFKLERGGVIRAYPLLSGDLRGADPAEPAAVPVSADDADRLAALAREMLALVERIRGRATNEAPRRTPRT